jgi:micrococcal nuclease
LTSRSLAVLLLIVALLGPPGLLRAQELLPATVVGITDGDTITVQFGDGARERVRLIGIDTPESVDPRRPVQCFGPEASQHTKELLDGQAVALELDVEQRDRFGRLLAYVWLGETNVNVRIAADGYAQQLTIPPNVKYVDPIRQAVAEAREAGRGLWSACQAVAPPGDYEPTAADVPAEAPAPAPAQGQPVPPPAGPPPPMVRPQVCDAAYPDVCIPPPPPDLDCGDIPDRGFRVLPPDPHRFDGDRDGVGCER